jgi:hypothetical protein
VVRKLGPAQRGEQLNLNIQSYCQDQDVKEPTFGVGRPQKEQSSLLDRVQSGVSCDICSERGFFQQLS